MNSRDAPMKGATKKYMAEVDPTELACRMLEAMQNMKRPVGVSAKVAIGHLDPESRARLMAAANAVLGYIAECFSASTRVS